MKGLVMNMKKIYETIRDLREDNDLKQKDVADYLKMSRTTYNHYELGHTSFTADMIVDLAYLFKTTPNVLLNFDSQNEITDVNLIKLCNFIKEKDLNTEEVINLITCAKKI